MTNESTLSIDEEEDGEDLAIKKMKVDCPWIDSEREIKKVMIAIWSDKDNSSSEMKMRKRICDLLLTPEITNEKYMER
ncbi:unnamed protein product [Spirodela intermedia]|uniref:Uncharacterized protein n=1 Tax=Spirodela intermedia TaxID=51605 RepID=A0A7I8JFQ9_SPIIN|nr:unnamed protein product [Spirodela intermedia]CAA6669018.1 unnamed protein product [Spirodela intermedia]